MKLQIQSVIYRNEIESLKKAVMALKHSVQVCRKTGISLDVRLVYGDSSPEPVFSEQDVALFSRMLGDEVSFIYRPFGFNSGTAAGHNMMADCDDLDFVMIMNPDIIMEPRCITNLMTKLLEDEHVGMAEARQTPLEHAKTYDAATGETEWASTACVIIRKDAMQKIGGFDQASFFMYCDDLDFSWHLRLAGYKILYVPSAMAYHAKKLTNEAQWMPSSAEVYYSAEAAMLLAYKWSNKERADYLYNYYSEHGGDAEKKAAASYLDHKKSGKLPIQLDPEHKIARFLGNEYCDMRFNYGR